MLDADNPAENTTTETDAPGAPGASAGQPAGQAPGGDDTPAGDTPVKKTAKKTAKKSTTRTAAAKSPAKKAAKKTAAPDVDPAADAPAADAPAADVPGADAPAVEAGTDAPDAAKKPARKSAKRTAAKRPSTSAEAAGDAETLPVGPDADTGEAGAGEPGAGEAAATPPAKKSTRTRRPKAAATDSPAETQADAQAGDAAADPAAGAPSVLFKAPDPNEATRPRRSTKKAASADEAGGDARVEAEVEDPAPKGDQESDAGDSDRDEDGESGEGGGRRRRRRGGRRRRKGGEGGDNGEGSSDNADDESDPDKGSETESGKGSDGGSGRGSGGGSGQQSKQGSGKGSGQQSKQGSGKGSGKGQGSGQGAGQESGSDQGESDEEGGSRRRRRRRRSGEGESGSADDPQNTVTRVRKSRSPEDEITALSGSTRLEAKKQRRREGREAGRRRAPIVSEAEFLARREAVDRVMVIRQRKELTQIAVLEDKVLVEHYVARESQTSLIGNVYLGRVQNVLPSMEAAFVDIGKGRNAVIYAGEVNWTALGAKDNQPRKIESVLKSGQQILVQVTKDPVGHKGARLTSQISLPGRFLVYVPDGTTSGISRKLPDTERSRLKAQLKEIVPEGAGVIVRTAAEGASDDELTRDVERLTARWEDIEKKVKAGNAPQLLYGEPDLTLKVVRDLFTEDFGKLVVQGDEAWGMVEDYVQHVAPDLSDRLERHDPGAGNGDGTDVFAVYRIDEQIAKALDRKVWLPSGGSLIIDRTEAMTVVDVNTGKFTGSGGNLEETVTKNNLEAAEEMVRQLRLRDIGGIIVVDFIDMVLESNRDLVLRRMVECLGRDRTRHQVAEVTSLGLVQMTRKRIGTGLLEAFSENCEHCHGRGLVVHHEPVEPSSKSDDDSRRSRRGRGRGGEQGGGNDGNGNAGDGGNQGKGGKGTKSNAGDKGGQGGQGGQGGKGGQGTKGSDSHQGGQAAAGSDHGEGNGKPSPKDFAAMARREDEAPADEAPADEAPADEAPADEAPADEVSAHEAPAAEAPAAEGGDDAEPAPVSTAPRTTTRRRSARRVQGPAGEPVAVSAVPAADDTGSEEPPPVAPTETGAADAGPTDAGPTEAGTPAEAPEPAAPRVVATTRRRTARRPAGPPSGDQGEASEQPENPPDA